LDANQAVSFFALIWNPDANVQPLSLDNNKTQEKLVIKGAETYPELGDFVTISRYTGAKEEWIKEIREVWEVIEKRNQERNIVVDLNIKSGYFTCPLF
jgi:hypothetical protein